MLSERITQIDPKKAHQLELEKLYNKNQTLKRIRSEFTNCDEFNFTAYMLEREIDPDFGFDLLVQMALHKRTTLPILVGILRRHHDNIQETSDAILKCAEADLVDWNPTLKQFILIFNISDEVQADIDRFQFPLPMVVHPQKVKDNFDNGYMLTRGSLILRNNHHDDDICLDHINKLNDIKLCHDHDTAHMIKNQWRDLDKAKPTETQADYEKRVRAFEKYDRTAKEVIDLLLVYGNEFYLTHKYDKRGRSYCQGYHVNYQGAPWNKAVIELAEKEVVTL
jgi:hypothetical protein